MSEFPIKSTGVLGIGPGHSHQRAARTGSQVFTWAPVPDWSRQIDGHVLISDWHQLSGNTKSAAWTSFEKMIQLRQVYSLLVDSGTLLGSIL